MVDYKQKDREAIVAYLRERTEVSVSELIAQSGAEPMRVYPLLFELAQSGQVEVLAQSEFGAAEVVKYVA